MRAYWYIIALCFCAGCSTFPEMETSRAPAVENAPYPGFLSPDDLLALVPPTATSPQTLDGRIAELNARAAKLRQKTP